MRTYIPPQKEETSIFLEEWLNMEICELSLISIFLEEWLNIEICELSFER
jgi:hypothetical protein